ncbi:DNA-binding transcriptional regulator, LacI/PurR family [Pseudarcicella hirudinis]|uniref:DNA-binding transcriptional regulator, LacI/PurR family n=1 Tax=Pseudarcicella hirudinis TaxID=1079859 RepID=A0A1I5RPK1_9BACT|nr:substrate-binding domain-containing protein [Pseudarcicella hirudinis]SFP60330.1 DNA-binding transcriptional regulator, LacI/PurR family [Pseudarcicella hirudinis]
MKKSNKILLVFNRINDFKNEIYNGFLNVIDGSAIVDLYIHQINNQHTRHFDEVIREKISYYDHFVIMLHANQIHEDILRTVNSIPKEKLVVLDKKNEFIRGDYACVYQDFENDIYGALLSSKPLLEKYNTLNLLIPERYFYSLGITEGLIRFCKEHGFGYNIHHSVEEGLLKSKEAYIVLSEVFLAEILKGCMRDNLTVGKDIGIISYNETPLKEVLSGGITVVTTDHAQLGKSAAELILKGKREHIRNPFVLIQRKSL